MSAREIKGLRNAIAVTVNDCSVMMARMGQIEIMLHKLQTGLTDEPPMVPLNVDLLSDLDEVQPTREDE